MERNVLLDVSGLLMIVSFILGLNDHWLMAYGLLLLLSGITTGVYHCDKAQINASMSLSFVVFAVAVLLFFPMFGLSSLLLSGAFFFHTYIYSMYWLSSSNDKVTRITLMQSSEIGLVVGCIFLLMALLLPYEAFYFMGFNTSELVVRLASVIFTLFFFGMNSFLYLMNRKALVLTLSSLK